MGFHDVCGRREAPLEAASVPETGLWPRSASGRWMRESASMPTAASYRCNRETWVQPLNRCGQWLYPSEPLFLHF